jgi:hypothetical protein
VFGAVLVPALIYEDDFQVTAEPGSDAGLVAIDHTAQALPVGQMEAAVLFWRAVSEVLHSAVGNPGSLRAGSQPRHGEPGRQHSPTAEHLLRSRDSDRPVRLGFCRRWRPPSRLRQPGHRAHAHGDAQWRRLDVADPAELLRRSRREVRAQGRGAGFLEGTQPASTGVMMTARSDARIRTASKIGSFSKLSSGAAIVVSAP